MGLFKVCASRLLHDSLPLLRKAPLRHIASMGSLATSGCCVLQAASGRRRG